MRPDLKIVAVAAPDNWTFHEKLRPDERAVDFFHACKHLGEVGDRRDRLVRQASRDKYRAVLRDDGKGVDKVAMRYLRDKATTKAAVAAIERERRFFHRHRRRTRYASLKTKGCIFRHRPPTRCWSTNA